MNQINTLLLKPHRKWVCALFLGIGALSVWSPAYADQFLTQLKNRALAGDPKAQVDLGKKYLEGSGGAPKDCTQALMWFRKAADQGYVMAENSLGYAYEVGSGVPKNYEEARKWYAKAAAQGDAYAKSALERLSASNKIRSPKNNSVSPGYHSGIMNELKSSPSAAKPVIAFEYMILLIFATILCGKPLFEIAEHIARLRAPFPRIPDKGPSLVYKLSISFVIVSLVLMVLFIFRLIILFFAFFGAIC